MSTKQPLRPGDVVCTRTPRGWQVFLIRLGAAFRDRPNTVNHVIVVHHRDDAGTLWGIEARPGGVGWVDVAAAVRASGRYSLNNVEQPKSDMQRQSICDAVAGMIGTPYDWTGIALAGMDAIGAQKLWRERTCLEQLKLDVPPAHVICSSLADWAYDRVQLASPGLIGGRSTTPGDWARFIMEEAWRTRTRTDS